VSHDPRHLLELACERAVRGERLALCLVVKSRGSTPQSAGSLMLVDENAQLHGTVGGGCVEAEVRRSAHELLHANCSALLRYTLDHDYGWDDGLICGGTIEIAVVPVPPAAELRELLANIDRREPAELAVNVDSIPEPRRFVYSILPRERLIIAGGGHVGQAVARLALRLEFEVTLVDDRPETLADSPPGANTRCGDIARELRALTIDEGTFALVVTRGHRHDEQALEALLGRGARYLGMIGSRRKSTLIFNDLRARGADDAELARVRTPVGLPIGAVSVEEIAIAIAAQLVEVRRSSRIAAVREITSGEPRGAAAAIATT